MSRRLEGARDSFAVVGPKVDGYQPAISKP